MGMGSRKQKLRNWEIAEREVSQGVRELT